METKRTPVSGPNAVVKVGDVEISNAGKLTIIAGPCQMEGRENAFIMARELKKMMDARGIGFIYKTSFDKANRTSAKAPRGLGLERALPVFRELRAELGIPVLTDVHDADQCAPVADAVDVLQIPAFLCRQTDLLIEAARTGKVINVKKGQFLAPWDMKNVIEKITGAGNPTVLVTERGASFGYNTLVNDMRALPIMAKFGAPVVFDATHSVQQPGGLGTATGGDRTMVPYLARAAVAAGVSTVFLEVHQDPDYAPSDGPNMMKLEDVPALLDELMAIDAIVKHRK